jgi:hypothetical protein
LAFLGVLGDPECLGLLHQSLARADLALGAARGLGALGRLEAIPALLEAMTKPELARAAGDAFRRITGAEDLTGERAERAEPPGPDLEAEFADDEPTPDPVKARAWWQARQAEFKPSRRWQAGREVDGTGAAAEFRALPLEIRRDLFLCGRAAQSPALRDFEPERRAKLQG